MVYKTEIRPTGVEKNVWLPKRKVLVGGRDKLKSLGLTYIYYYI